MLDKIASSLTLIVVFVYLTLSVMYCFDKQWNKAFYWLGAAILSFAVLRMK